MCGHADASIGNQMPFGRIEMPISARTLDNIINVS